MSMHAMLFELLLEVASPASVRLLYPCLARGGEGDMSLQTAHSYDASLEAVDVIQ